MPKDRSRAVTFESAIPILPSLDITVSEEFYVDIGFESVFSNPDGDEPYAIIERDGVQVHFWECDDPWLPSNSSCRIEVSDVDSYHEAFQRPSAIFTALEETSFGTQEFVIKDPHENLMWFFDPVPDGVQIDAS